MPVKNVPSLFSLALLFVFLSYERSVSTKVMSISYPNMLTSSFLFSKFIPYSCYNCLIDFIEVVDAAVDLRTGLVDL